MVLDFKKYKCIKDKSDKDSERIISDILENTNYELDKQDFINSSEFKEQIGSYLFQAYNSSNKNKNT